MFKKNPITQIEMDYLRQIAPYRRWHFLLLIPAFIMATLPLFHSFHRQDAPFVALMAIIILSTYWLLQLRTMYLAIKVVNHDWKSHAPDEMIGTVSNQQAILGKLRAVLIHQQLWIVLISITLLGLSLAVMGWKYRSTGSLSQPSSYLFKVLMNVGAMYMYYYADSQPLPHVFQMLVALIVLICNVILQLGFITILCLLTKSLRAIWLYALVVFLAVAIFFVAINIRNHQLESYAPVTLFRIVESIQATMTVFVDSGTVLVTSLLCPSGYFHMTGSMYRHLLATGLGFAIQLGLSGILLRYAIRNANPKSERNVGAHG